MIEACRHGTSTPFAVNPSLLVHLPQLDALVVVFEDRLEAPSSLRELHRAALWHADAVSNLPLPLARRVHSAREPRLRFSSPHLLPRPRAAVGLRVVRRDDD